MLQTENKDLLLSDEVSMPWWASINGAFIFSLEHLLSTFSITQMEVVGG